MTELIGRGAVQAQGSLFKAASVSSVEIEDGAIFESRIIDITDPISDPENALPDFGDAVNLSFVRDWVLCWSFRLNLADIVPPGWFGTNRSMLFLEVFDFTATVPLTSNSQNLYRLWIPAGTARYVYTGSRVIHSRRARVHIQNDSGGNVLFDLDVWAKSWE